MTCIAWDGESLAGDRQGDVAGTKVRIRKVFRVVDRDGRTWLMGGAGPMDLVEQYRLWLQGSGEKPSFTKDDHPAILLVDQKRRVFVVSYTITPVRLHQKKAAVGAARAEALGAMACGRSAAAAVRIASLLDSSVGMGVDVVRF